MLLLLLFGGHWVTLPTTKHEVTICGDMTVRRISTNSGAQTRDIAFSCSVGICGLCYERYVDQHQLIRSNWCCWIWNLSDYTSVYTYFDEMRSMECIVLNIIQESRTYRCSEVKVAILLLLDVHSPVTRRRPQGLTTGAARGDAVCTAASDSDRTSRRRCVSRFCVHSMPVEWMGNCIE